MMRPISVFPFEVDELKNKLDNFKQMRTEIAELGKLANEQGSETFGHDNFILEAKHEKERLLALMLPEERRIQKLLLSCLVISEDQMHKNGSIGVGSIVTYGMNDQVVVTALITGIVQGKKVKFKGKEYATISSQSPIRKGLCGKSVGDITPVSIGGQVKMIKIISVE